MNKYTPRDNGKQSPCHRVKRSFMEDNSMTVYGVSVLIVYSLILCLYLLFRYLT